ncbi:MAG: hypothetical protein ACLUCH_05355 [Lachnospirales bacterium]
MNIKIYLDSYINYEVNEKVLKEMKQNSIDLLNINEIGEYIMNNHFNEIADDILECINFRYCREG